MINPRRKYDLWDNAFKTINSNKSAYWLGFTFGGVYLKLPSVSKKTGENLPTTQITISSHKKQNLVDLAEYLNLEKKKFTRNIGKTSYMYLSSRNMYEHLSSFGIPPSKRTLSMNFPSLSDSFKTSFIRGYCDNNSNTYFNQGYLVLSINGPKHFLEPIRDFLNSKIDIGNPSIYQKNTGAGCIRFGGIRAMNVIRHLYGGRYVDKIRSKGKKHIVKIL